MRPVQRVLMEQPRPFDVVEAAFALSETEATAGEIPEAGGLRGGDSDSTIFPLLELDWQLQIDQSCLEERQREHVARMRVERIIERIAAALPEL